MIDENESPTSIKEKIIELDKRIKQNPDNANYYNLRGAYYLALKDYPSSLEDFNKALELDPGDPVIWDNRGTLKTRMDDFTSAEKDYRKAVQLDSNNFQYLNNLGWAQMNLEKFDSAIICFNKALEKDPGNGMVYLNRGLAFGAAGNRTQCCEDIQKAKQAGVKEAESYLLKYCASKQN